MQMGKTMFVSIFAHDIFFCEMIMISHLGQIVTSHKYGKLYMSVQCKSEREPKLNQDIHLKCFLVLSQKIFSGSLMRRQQVILLNHATSENEMVTARFRF